MKSREDGKNDDGSDQERECQILITLKVVFCIGLEVEKEMRAFIESFVIIF